MPTREVPAPDQRAAGGGVLGASVGRALSLAERAVVALERLAAAQEQVAGSTKKAKPGPKPKPAKEPVEVTELDRRRARDLARRMGLVVRESPRR